MTRSRRRLTGFLAFLGLAAFAANAEAIVRHHHPLHHRGAAVASRSVSFPAYVDTGSDRNPGGDNLYFSDTKSPNYLNREGTYIIGPAWFQRWW